MTGTFLPIYLNDHLMGATAVTELTRRAAREHEHSELGTFLAQLAVEIAEDRRALRRLMVFAGARPALWKVTAAWLAEKLGRGKLNGRILSRSPLSPMVELEAIEIGIYGKLLLWRVLRAQSIPTPSDVDLDALTARAQRQLEQVESHRVNAGASLRG